MAEDFNPQKETGVIVASIPRLPNGGMFGGR
jgi:hypothetical protein